MILESLSFVCGSSEPSTVRRMSIYCSYMCEVKGTLTIMKVNV